MAVAVVPSGQSGQVKAIEANGGSLQAAFAGDSVDVSLTGIDPQVRIHIPVYAWCHTSATHCMAMGLCGWQSRPLVYCLPRSTQVRMTTFRYKGLGLSYVCRRRTMGL